MTDFKEKLKDKTEDRLRQMRSSLEASIGSLSGVEREIKKSSESRIEIVEERLNDTEAAEKIREKTEKHLSNLKGDITELEQKREVVEEELKRRKSEDNN